jgi:hypothetical protein
MISKQYLEQAAPPAPRPPVTAELCASIDRVEHVTKPSDHETQRSRSIVTKAPIVTKPKRGGRPPIGATAMTAGERQARRRSKLKVNGAEDRAALAPA